MKIGDSILRQVNTIVNVLERQFDVIELIDNFDFSERDEFDLLISCTKSLHEISDCERVQIYVKQNDAMELCYSSPNDTDVLTIDEKILPRRTNLTRLVNQRQQQRALFVIKLESSYFPEVILVLIDNYFGRAVNKLHEREFQDYMLYVNQKLTEKMETYARTKQLENYKRLSENFIREGLDKRLELSYESDRRRKGIEFWSSILGSVFDYMPEWGPLSYGDEKPRIQILTVQKGRQYLTVRAETEANNDTGEWIFRQREFQLKRSSTICGLCLDLEERGEVKEFLLENPTEHTDRYAAMLFSDEEIPESELIIPIKDERGKTIAMFNFEHREKGAFPAYRIDMFKTMVDDLSPFVKFAISEQERYIDKEKELRYLLRRIASRLSRTQSHKTDTDFGLLVTAVRESKREIKGGNYEDAVKQLEQAEEKISELKTVSTDFSVHIGDYIKFGRRKFEKLVKDALPDTKKRAALTGDNIVFREEAIPSDLEVFCSGLAREHIYNVIQNAIEQFILVRKNKEKFSGVIEIECNEVERTRKEKNIFTYDFIEVSVSDNGGGVPPGYEEKIFERDFTLREEGGSGFGLSSAFEYMERIGGSLILENNYPDGATFKFQFPEYTEELHEPMAKRLNLQI